MACIRVTQATSGSNLTLLPLFIFVPEIILLSPKLQIYHASNVLKIIEHQHVTRYNLHIFQKRCFPQFCTTQR